MITKVFAFTSYVNSHCLLLWMEIPMGGALHACLCNKSDINLMHVPVVLL